MTLTAIIGRRLIISNTSCSPLIEPGEGLQVVCHKNAHTCRHLAVNGGLLTRNKRSARTGSYEGVNPQQNTEGQWALPGCHTSFHKTAEPALDMQAGTHGMASDCPSVPHVSRQSRPMPRMISECPP